ncbi:hypothetical protein [Gordonia paraffinivorans]|uniref:hypothetical protein n=1 Tax=Gordonia paraffinivorans TaxID=175628 RepID=UPI001FD4DB13|nr:hypothetical protein [Gordonia paraffinivorans]
MVIASGTEEQCEIPFCGEGAESLRFLRLRVVEFPEAHPGRLQVPPGVLRCTEDRVVGCDQQDVEAQPGGLLAECGQQCTEDGPSTTAEPTRTDAEHRQRDASEHPVPGPHDIRIRDLPQCLPQTADEFLVGQLRIGDADEPDRLTRRTPTEKPARPVGGAGPVHVSGDGFPMRLDDERGVGRHDHRIVI